MAQRGGSVLSTVRFGEHVWSPVSPHADVVIATELLEGHPRPRPARRRAAPWSAPSPRASRRAACCAARRTTRTTWPARPRCAACGCSPSTPRALACEAGTLRAVNVALLGAASTVLPFTEEHWRRGLEAAVPAKILEVNLRAFELGRAAVASQEVES